MKLHFIYKTFISFLLAFLMVVPASIQAAQPKDDNTVPISRVLPLETRSRTARNPSGPTTGMICQPTSTKTILWSSTMTPNITT